MKKKYLIDSLKSTHTDTVKLSIDGKVVDIHHLKLTNEEVLIVANTKNEKIQYE